MIGRLLLLTPILVFLVAGESLIRYPSILCGCPANFECWGEKGGEEKCIVVIPTSTIVTPTTTETTTTPIPITSISQEEGHNYVQITVNFGLGGACVTLIIVIFKRCKKSLKERQVQNALNQIEYDIEAGLVNEENLIDLE